jgi:hypothetical protein
MVMPRPSGKALKIAKKVIPGLSDQATTTSHSKKPKILSQVEINQTNQIENRKGLVPFPKKI